jgi:general secretion pathway protein G
MKRVHLVAQAFRPASRRAALKGCATVQTPAALKSCATWRPLLVRPFARLPLTLQQGYTFIELLVVATIILVLASAVMPLAKVTAQRQREAELRRALREMRTAIDRFKDAADLGFIGSLDLKAGSENYPADLQQLVDGVTAANDATGRKLKFLRRIPIDPMTHGSEWGLRSYQDKPDSTRWGGQNVFDVYTTFGGTALDGTKYKDW